jgi:hypothetical protein
MNCKLLIWMSLFVPGIFVPLSAATAQTPKERVALVELFTSEGCSSCPPADALLRRLNGTRTEDSVLIVGLSEHVTYWNNLGWADPFSQATYTDRQTAYGDQFRLDSVYTPQVVVNGQKQVLGSDSRALLEAVRSTTTGGVDLHIQSAVVDKDRLQVTYAVSGPVPARLELWAAIADDMATSSVTRGENGGRTLAHVSVARSLTRVGGISSAGIATISLPVPAVIPGQQKTGRHLVLFAQEQGAGKVLAVESRPL